MNRLGLLALAALTVAWIVASLFLLPGWTVSSLMRNIAVWIDIPLAAWLGALAWMSFRGKRRSSQD